MTSSAHARATLVLGLPLIGSSLAQMALHVVDTVMLGWYGVVALAAVVLGASSFFIAVRAGIGLCQGGDADGRAGACARRRGAGAPRRRGWGCGCRSLSAWLVYPVFWWSEPILLALGQEPEVSAIAQRLSADRGLGHGAGAVGDGAAKLAFGAGADAGGAVGDAGGAWG